MRRLIGGGHFKGLSVYDPQSYQYRFVIEGSGSTLINGTTHDATANALQVCNGPADDSQFGCNVALLSVRNDGNVGIGTTSPVKALDVSGTIRTSAKAGDTGGVLYPDGTQQATAWTGVVCGGDYAESVDVSGERTNYRPGDVLVIGAESGSDVAKSFEPYSTLVLGVYATRPGVVGRRQATDAKSSTTEVPMAMGALFLPR